MQLEIKKCEHKCYLCRVNDAEVFNVMGNYCCTCWDRITYPEINN